MQDFDLERNLQTSQSWMVLGFFSKKTNQKIFSNLKRTFLFIGICLMNPWILTAKIYILLNKN